MPPRRAPAALFFCWVLLLVGCDETRRYGALVAPDASPSVDADQTDDEPEVGADSSADADGVCAEIDLPVIRVTPRVLIVLDRSNSLNERDHWEALREAVIDLGRQTERKLALGLMLFPETEGRRACDGYLNQCEAPSDPSLRCRPGHAGEIEDRLMATSPCGGTPTAATLRAAAQAFVEFESPTRVPSSPGAGDYLLLATDGAPNCNDAVDDSTCRCTSTLGCDDFPLNCLDDQATLEAIDALTSLGVSTFVLGIRASQWADVLDAMASAGGTDRAYLAIDHQDIVEALEAIAAGLTTCEVAFLEPGLQADPELVNFYLDGERVDRASGDDCREGWRWTDDSQRRVVFCGSACDALRSGDVDEVRATFGCTNLI